MRKKLILLTLLGSLVAGPVSLALPLNGHHTVQAASDSKSDSKDKQDKKGKKSKKKGDKKKSPTIKTEEKAAKKDKKDKEKTRKKQDKKAYKKEKKEERKVKKERRTKHKAAKKEDKRNGTTLADPKDCADFSSQAAAQSYYVSHGGPDRDPSDLDRDGDGNACEAL